MASSVSLLNNYNGSLFTFANKELLMQGLMMKQGAYDLNKSRLEQLRHQVGFLDVAKTSDQEYLNRRLAEADNVIKSTIENGDLSNTYLVDQISSKIEDIIDEPILNAVVSTQARRQEDKQWKDAREANDGSYSDINYAVMSHNWNKYLQDDRVGTKYQGGGGFVPFVDINQRFTSKEFNQGLKDAGINAEYVINSAGEGEFKALNKYEGTVDPNRLKAYINSFLGEDGKKQLQINSVYDYGYGNTPESVGKLREDYNSRINSYLDNANSRLEAINLQLSGDLSPEERERYQSAKSDLEAQITSNQSRNFDNDVVGTDGFIDENKFLTLANNVYSSNKMDELFNMTYMNPIFKDRQLDEVQAKYVEFNEQKRQFNLGFSLRQEQFELNKANYRLNVAKEGFQLDEAGNLIPIQTSGVGGTLNQANVMLGQGTLVTEEEAGDADVSREMRMEYQKAIDGIYKSMKGNWSESATAKLENILATQDFYAGQDIDLGNGRKLKVTEENIGYVQTLSDIAKGQNTTTALYSNVLTKRVGLDDAGVIDWKKARQYGNTPNIYFVKSEDGRSYTAKSGKMPSAKNNNLAYVASKIDSKGWEALTDEEKMTANFYKIKIASSELDLNKDERFLLNRAFNRRMGDNVQSLKNAIVKTNKEDYNNKLREYSDQIAITRMVAGAISPQASNLVDKRLIEDARNFTSQKNDDLIFGKVGLLKDGSKEGFESGREAVINYSRSIINRDQVVLTPPVTSKQEIKDQENVLYNSLRVRLGEGNNFKGDIILQRVIKKGKPTNEFSVKLDKKDADGNVVREKKDIILKEEDLVSRGIQLATPENTTYNTELGDFSATTNIRPSKNFTSPIVGKLDVRQGTPQYYSDRVNSMLKNWESQIKLIQGDENFNIYNLTQSQSKIFSNPKVVIRPEGDEYYMTLDLGNDKYMPFGESLGKSVSMDRIATLKLNGDDNILGALRAYISNITSTPLQ